MITYKQYIIYISVLLLICFIAPRNSNGYINHRILSPQTDTTKLIRQPYLQTVLSDSATIMWKTNRGKKCYVKYGKTPEMTNKVTGVIENQHVNTMNEVSLHQLEPHTKYYYQIYTDGRLLASGKDYYFKSAPLKGKNSFNFYAMGDIGHEKRGYPQISADQIDRIDPRPDFGLLLGDIVYHNGKSEKYDRLFFEPLSAILKNIPVYPVLGNHDWGSDPKKNYEQEWKLPNNEHYYSFGYSNALFIGLDSKGGNFYHFEKQKKWLKRTLAKEGSKYDWIIVYLHHPGRTCTTRGANKAVMSLYPIFAHNNVDIVLNGHAHTYERLNPYDKNGNVIAKYTNDIHNYPSLDQGFISITSGTGGGKLAADRRPVDCKQPEIVASTKHVLQFLRFTIQGKKLKMEAIRALTGETFDEFIIEK